MVLQLVFRLKKNKKNYFLNIILFSFNQLLTLFARVFLFKTLVIIKRWNLNCICKIINLVPQIHMYVQDWFICMSCIIPNSKTLNIMFIFKYLRLNNPFKLSNLHGSWLIERRKLLALLVCTRESLIINLFVSCICYWNTIK